MILKGVVIARAIGDKVADYEYSRITHMSKLR